MKKIIKNTIVFASVLILSLMTSIIFMGSRVKAADLGDGSFSVKYDDIDEYYGEKAPEYQNGYLFAGWYTDEMCTSSYVRKDGDGVTTFYAKFVPQAVLSVKAQHAVALHNKVLADTDTGSIRFVTATDSNNYNEVGLHVEGTIGSHTLDKDYKVGTIYSYLYVVGDTTNDKSNPVAASAVFGTDAAEYFAPHAFKINFTQFDDDFTITPYWITPDGVRVDGVKRTRNMIENLEDYSYAEVNGRAYYTSNDLSTVYTAALGESSLKGTKDSPTVMTLLKDNMTVTGVITVRGNLQYLTIQNKENIDAKISRGTDFTDNMFVVNANAVFQLGTNTGTLIIDASSEEAVAGRTVNVKSEGNFILQQNATLQNANSTASGAALCNTGTCNLYGNMLNNKSSAGSSSAYGAGAILQVRNSGNLTIYSGTYEGNENTGDYGAGGVIGTQIINDAGELAGSITIAGGTFSNNSAAYGGVVSSYTTNKVTISDGTFTSNGTQKNEADEVISVCAQGGVVYLFKNATLDITGGEFNSNQADTYGGVISTLNQVGEINITGGEFTSNYAGTYGGVVSIARRGVLNIDGGNFSGNSAGSYGGVISTTQGNTTSNGATINITNGKFTANIGTPDGGVIYVNKSGALNISGGTFSGNSVTTQGGVISTAEGFNTVTDTETSTETITALPISVTINGGTFSSNSATTDGGVVLINKYASLTVNNGSFNENTGTTYGAVISTIDGSTSDNAPKITINNGTFTSNTGTYGGVVFVDKYVTLDVVDGLFTSNSAKNGGVIGSVTGTSATLRAVVNITDGEFSLNSATQYGGVAHLGAYGKVTVDGGNFSNNSSDTNGGVISTAGTSTTDAATVIINNGTFESNTASDGYGGVIWQNKYVSLTIGGGTFTQNSASCGGVVRIENYGKLTIANTSQDESKSILFNQNEATGYGAGVIFVGDRATATISDATMTGNCAPYSTSGYGGGAITLHGGATVTIENCSISGNAHAGILADEEKNMDGCDIAFTGQGSNKTQTLILQDSTSFSGIGGQIWTTQNATLNVKLEDGTILIPEYNTRWTINYNEHTLEKVYAHRVILVSDMHYTTNMTKEEYDDQYNNLINNILGTEAKASYAAGPTFGYSQNQKIQAIFSDIDTYIAKEGAIESVMLLGDLSIDNKGYSNLREDYLSLMKTNFLDKLSYPWYAIAGNHDSYKDSEWEGIIGTKRQYSVVVGDAVFIMLDTFEAVHATSNSGSSYVGVNTEFLATELAKEEYADKKIFLCSHYYRPGEDTEEDTALQNLIANDDRIVCMFRGHSHTNAVYEPAVLDGRPLVDIGGYAYNSTGTSITLEDGTASTTYNVFSEANAWGYQVLEWDDSEVHLYHVKPARKYTDYLGVEHDYAGAIENEVIIKLN